MTLLLVSSVRSNPEEESSEVKICGGFIEFDDTEKNTAQIKKDLDLSSIVIRSYTSDMILKEQTNVA